MTPAKRSVLRLECPREEPGKSAGFLLQVVDDLKVVHAMLEFLAASEHHGGGRAHAELVSGAMDVQPISGEALQAGDAVAHLVVQNLGAAARDGIEAGI